MPSEPTEPITLADWAERYRAEGEPCASWRRDPSLDAMMRDIDWSAPPTVVVFNSATTTGKTYSWRNCPARREGE